MMLFSMAAVAGPGHNNHKKTSWVEQLGLTEAQAEQVKTIKQANHKKLVAYKESLANDVDEQLAAVLSNEQMAQYKAMRQDNKKHMAEKKNKKHKKHKRDHAE